MSDLARRLDYLNKQNQRQNNAESNLLDLATDISLGFINAYSEQNKIDAAEKRIKNTQDRQVRTAEINRIQKIFPDMSTFNYGDPFSNEDDFEAFRKESNMRVEMLERGSKFTPTGPNLSDAASEDMYTYGVGDSRITVDPSSNIITTEDLFDYDAWLLGENAVGPGKETAMRNNWTGLLSNFDEEIDGYIIDEDAYIDLKSKGIVDHLNSMPYENNLYVVSENEKANILKNYKYWREGFDNSRDLKSTSELSSAIQDLNRENSKKLSTLLNQSQFKNASENVNRWGIGGGGFGIEVDNGTGLKMDIIEKDDSKATRLPKSNYSKEDFYEKYPLAAEWYYGNASFENAYEKYISNPELQKELEFLPTINTLFQQQIEDYFMLENAKKAQGIVPSQEVYLQDRRVSDARNIILDDLYDIEIGGQKGAIFDSNVLNQLTDGQINSLLDQLETLESSYYMPNSVNQNIDAVRFLEAYGLNAGGLPGEAIQNLINELGAR